MEIGVPRIAKTFSNFELKVFLALLDANKQTDKRLVMGRLPSSIGVCTSLTD